MRPWQLASVLALAVAACGYEAPELSDARFRCDPGHGCPGGQVCRDGFCAPPDGVPIDGPSVDGQYDGLVCGSQVCAIGMECCTDIVGGVHCQPISQGCAGVSIQCDGPEDCPGGECCLSGITGSCVSAGACATGPLCHVITDCPESGDQCCTIPQTQWHGCYGNCP